MIHLLDCLCLAPKKYSLVLIHRQNTGGNYYETPY
jgi:hypothetical protein